VSVTTQDRVRALSAFLGYEITNVMESPYFPHTFRARSSWYQVLTNQEAHELALTAVLTTHKPMHETINRHLKRPMLHTWQLSEQDLRKQIKDLNAYYQEAIAEVGGRGLMSVFGQEHEYRQFFIYPQY
jgi:hypothetical protein